MLDGIGEKIDKKKVTELWNKRVSPAECPSLKACEKKVLEEECLSICKDKELSGEIVQVHMAKKHMWEFCDVYQKAKREKDGKLPKEWI